MSCKKDPTGCHEELQFYLGTKRRKSDITLKKSMRTLRRREYCNQGDGLSILETGSLISRGGEFGKCDARLGNTEFFFFFKWQRGELE